MNNLKWITLFLFLSCGTTTLAQFPTSNPIAGSVPKSGLQFRLEKVVQIPMWVDVQPRLELLTFNNDGSGDLYVNDQYGDLYRFNPSTPDSVAQIADFSELVNRFQSGGQQGLRSFAFHPGYQDPASAGYLKLYTAHSETNNRGPNHDSVVAEWTLNADGIVDSSIASREILRFEQPRGDHNIGRIGFDPNQSPGDADWGNLYIALGDGGNFSNRDGMLNPNGQDTKLHLGSILRIDPANPDASAATPYSIPADNPFLGDTDFLPEIWAYGFRNPHTFGGDAGGDGSMYIGDIGQSDIEEINKGQAGGNFGWSEREGTFSVSGITPPRFGPIEVNELPADHPDDNFIYPVAQYDHSPTDETNEIGNAAVVGGYVFRSDRLPALQGKYLFGDFANNSGPIWVVDEDQLDQQEDFTDVASQDGGYLAPFSELTLLDDDGNEATFLDILRNSTGRRTLGRTDIRFGQGEDGEVYVMNKHDGWIRRFAAAVPGDCDGDGSVTTSDLACACADRDTVLTTLGLLPGDLNGDGGVAFDDFLVLSSNFGKGSDDTRVNYTDGDIDCDGQVAFADFLFLSSNFGKTSNITSVPEPLGQSCILMLFVCVSILLRKRR